jgi:hypothetical protein
MGASGADRVGAPRPIVVTLTVTRKTRVKNNALDRFSAIAARSRVSS